MVQPVWRAHGEIDSYKVDTADPEIQLLGVYSINKPARVSGSTLGKTRVGNSLNVRYEELFVCVWSMQTIGYHESIKN